MVPKGWSITALIKITKWSSGGTPSKNNPSFWNGEIPWISAASMRGHYYSDSPLKITDLAVSNTAKMANKDSILLLVRGSMLWNKIPVGITTCRVSFNQDVKCIVPHPNKLNVEFLLYWFLANENYLMNMVTGTGIGAGKLDTNDLQNLDLALPPLPEQQKIAKILSAWDKAISTTEALIDNSKQQKKALMQQLLTGKKRFAGFEGEWKDGCLGDLCAFKGGSAFKEIYQGKAKGNYPFIKVSDMNLRKNNKFIYQANNWISSDFVTVIKAKCFPSGSVVFAKVGAALLLNRRRILVRDTLIDNNMMAAIPIKSCSTEFLYQLLLMVDFAKLVQCGAVPSINQSDLSMFKIRYPATKDEQQKITSALTSADKEIELLKRQLVNLKQEKKALMQQLLTGKRRVKVDEVEARITTPKLKHSPIATQNLTTDHATPSSHARELETCRKK